MSFMESLVAVGLESQPYDSVTGWPEHLDLDRLVILQYPDSKEFQSGLYVGLQALCISNRVPWTKPKRPAGLYIGGAGAAFDDLLETTGYAISAEVFSSYLTNSGAGPSSHIANWFNERGGSSAPTQITNVSEIESKEARQNRRLQLCINSGLVMPSTHVGRLPDGIGKVAKSEGVSRQSFSSDIRAALERRGSTNREGVTVHRT